MRSQTILIENLSTDDLRELISKVVEEKLIKFSAQATINKNFLTRKEAAELLRLSLPTLADYTKKGLICGMRIGTRILYDREQLNNCLKEIETIKHRRA